MHAGVCVCVCMCVYVCLCVYVYVCARARATLHQVADFGLTAKKTKGATGTPFWMV